ncbi:permease-like cell division protein FtsX [Auraticoccus monumenti]|uniref:Cell division protein FtsX n=1 Tax=Auraticoccus monumenti TaxID=675864 RepID=A0A1G7E6W5_9ACTN|nr:permease-like cell division protein FtsX [Auraticoccus monumenti]SDE59216.1 cell division protein FtsX [Auraticoccus monumenti]
MRHIFSETWSGLRRHVSMVVAVVVTMFVSLTLFGAGLLIYQQADLLKDRWYDRVEISVFLCTPATAGDNCTPGAETTEAERQLVQQTLEENPEVAEVFFETKEEAFEEFQEAFEGSPIQESLTVDQMQESFRVKLVDPEKFEGVVSSVAGLPGVQAVQDMRQYLQPLIQVLQGLQIGAMATGGLLLLAAALQIGNTIRMAAVARRREIGIMRLVGASNSYIMAPFLLESLIAGVLGILLASAALATTVGVIRENSQVSLQTAAWIGWPQAGIAIAGVAVVGIVLSIVPTLVATRRYLRV